MDSYRKILNLFLLTLFLSIINCNKKNDIVPEDSFVPLYSHEMQKYTITPSQNEVYYVFDNKYNDSDIVINLKIGTSFTVHGYIYDSYDKIALDEEGQYTNFTTEIILNQKLIILKNSEIQIEETKYYIILKDIIYAANIDYITIFNEQDIINLQNQNPIVTDMFYSTNKQSLLFDFNLNETVTIELNTNNEDFEIYIFIYDSETEELIYKGIKTKGEIKFNEEKNLNGTFLIDMYSFEDPYTEIKLSLILYKESQKIIELTNKNNYNFAFVNTKIYNFYINLDNYEYNEENVLTFKFDNIVFDQNLLKHCNAKTMNFETNDENKLIANMPANDEENEALFERLTTSDSIYHLYFKKTTQKEQNKNSYLLIHLSLQNDDDIYFTPATFNIFVSEKTEKIDLSGLTDFTISKNLILQTYTPKIIRIVFPKNYENNYLLYTSEKVMELYNETMIGVSHLYDYKKQTFVINSNDNLKVYTLYLKLYSLERKINFRFESTKDEIYYLDELERPTKSLNKKLLDCSKGFYYIAEYETNNNKGHFYLEEIYGNFNLFYKNTFSYEDKSLLIHENDTYLIKNKLGNLTTNLELIELQCVSPGYAHLHLFEDLSEINSTIFSRKFGYLTANTNLQIIPLVNPNQENINIEISTPTGKELKINDGEKDVIINEKNKYYQVSYENYDSMPKLFIASNNQNEDAVVSIRVTNLDKFIILKDNYTHIEYQSQFILPFENNKNYESVSININRVYHEFSYSIFNGNYNYATYQYNSGYEYDLLPNKNTINLTISNPYLLNLNNNPESNYLVISANDIEMLQKDIYVEYNPIKQYEKTELGKPYIIDNNKKYSLPKINQNDNEINVIYQSCENSFDKINIYNYNDMLFSIKNSNIYSKYKVKTINNYLFDMQFNVDTFEIELLYKGAVIGFSNGEIKQEEIEYYENLKLNIIQDGKKISWQNISNVDLYEIYVLDENNEKIKYLKNPCFLKTIKENNDYIKYYSTKNNYYTLEEKGNYTVVVSANVQGKLPLIFIYNELKYSSKEEHKEEDDSNTLFWVLLISIILVVIIVLVIIVLVVIKLKKKKEDEEDVGRLTNPEVVERPSDLVKINNSTVENNLL